MRYTCDDLTQNDSFKLPAALWNADPKATMNGSGFTDADVQAQQKLVCANYDVTVPTYDGITVPECNYVLRVE